jgi:hypothetical protein
MLLSPPPNARCRGFEVAISNNASYGLNFS